MWKLCTRRRRLGACQEIFFFSQIAVINFINFAVADRAMQSAFFTPFSSEKLSCFSLLCYVKGETVTGTNLLRPLVIFSLIEFILIEFQISMLFLMLPMPKTDP